MRRSAASREKVSKPPVPAPAVVAPTLSAPGKAASGKVAKKRSVAKEAELQMVLPMAALVEGALGELVTKKAKPSPKVAAANNKSDVPKPSVKVTPVNQAKVAKASAKTAAASKKIVAEPVKVAKTRPAVAVASAKAPEVKKSAPKVLAVKKAGPRVKSGVELFVSRSGPRRGDPQLQAAFRTRREAVAFLANVHGLVLEEQKTLSLKGKLQLDFRRHGSEACAIQAVKFAPGEIDGALSGDRYL